MKYRLTDTSMDVTIKSTGETITVYQIESVATPYMRAFDNFSVTKGGWVESEHNLSQHGKCWICPKTVIIGKARIEGDANIRNSRIGGDIVISGRAVIQNSSLMGSGSIHGKSFLRKVFLDRASSLYLAGDNKFLNMGVNGMLVVAKSGLHIDNCRFLGMNRIFSKGSLKNSDFENIEMDCLELDIHDSKLSSQKTGYLHGKVKMKDVVMTVNELVLKSKVTLQDVYGFNVERFVANRHVDIKGASFGEGCNIEFPKSEENTRLFSEEYSEARIRGERDTKLEQEDKLAYSIRFEDAEILLKKSHLQGNLFVSGKWLMDKMVILANGCEILGNMKILHTLDTVRLEDFASIDFADCQTEQTLNKVELVDDMKISVGESVS